MCGGKDGAGPPRWVRITLLVRARGVKTEGTAQGIVGKTPRSVAFLPNSLVGGELRDMGMTPPPKDIGAGEGWHHTPGKTDR